LTTRLPKLFTATFANVQPELLARGKQGVFTRAAANPGDTNSGPEPGRLAAT